MLAWHFTRADRRLRYGDGRLVRVGETLRHDGCVRLCASGLHASVALIDALKYAPGPYVWRVRLGGEIVPGDDKVAASERTALWGYDASDVLRDFARRCALDVAHLWDVPPVVARWLRTGDESIRAAAVTAAEVVAADADYDTGAYFAANAAADAANAVPAAAAGAAADYAAAALGALDAARNKQNRRITAMIVAGMTP